MSAPPAAPTNSLTNAPPAAPTNSPANAPPAAPTNSSDKELERASTAQTWTNSSEELESARAEDCGSSEVFACEKCGREFAVLSSAEEHEEHCPGLPHSSPQEQEQDQMEIQRRCASAELHDNLQARKKAVQVPSVVCEVGGGTSGVRSLPFICS